MPVLIEDSDFTSQGFVAPSTFLKADKYVSNYNYYSTLAGAQAKLLYIRKLPGGSPTTPIGIKTFINNGKAQTFGVNCDFYALISGSWQLVSYNWIKSNLANYPIVYRFISTEGAGSYYAIMDPYYFGVAAINVGNVDPTKLAELDAFWREVQLMKYRYNALVGFLTELSKRQLNVKEQQIYNEGLLMLNNLSNEMSTIRGISIIYNSGGTIGLPILVIILIIAVLAAATAWTVSSIVSEKERTRRINLSYDLNKWVTEKKIQVAELAAAGKISEDSAKSINGTLDNAAAVANKVATDASKPKTGLGDIINVLKWAAVGYVGYLVYKETRSKKNAK
jgi:hypothetical protein